MDTVTCVSILSGARAVLENFTLEAGPPRAKRSGLLTHAMRTVYRPLKSKILVVFSASPAPFFSKLVACARARFQDPPDCRGQQILLATRQKCENVGGGTLGPERRRLAWPLRKDDTHKSRSVPRARTYVRAFRRAGGGSTSPNKL